MRLKAQSRHARGPSGLWSAMIAVVCCPAGVYALTQEQWLPAIVCLVIGPFCIYDAYMSYRAGNWT